MRRLVGLVTGMSCGALLAGCADVWGITTLTVDPGAGSADASRDGGGDAASPEAAADGTLPGAPPCPAPRVFCDDFEHGYQPGWSPELMPPATTAATIAIDAQLAHAGARSLHAHVEGTSSAFFFRYFTRQRPTLYVRVYAYVSPGTTATIGNLANLYNDPPVDASATTCAEYDLDAPGGLLSVSVGSVTTSAPGPALPSGKWTCLEWKLAVAPTNHASLSVDGTLAIDQDFAGIGDLSACQFDAYALGLEGLGSTPGDVYYDDLAIGPDPIGCP